MARRGTRLPVDRRRGDTRGGAGTVELTLAKRGRNRGDVHELPGRRQAAFALLAAGRLTLHTVATGREPRLQERQCQPSPRVSVTSSSPRPTRLPPGRHRTSIPTAP